MSMLTSTEDNLLLTERELKLMERLKVGSTIKEAAEDLGISHVAARQDIFRLNRKVRAWRRSLNLVEANRREYPPLLKYLPTARRRARRRRA